MDLDWFKDLSALAQTGNFSRAAQRSHISQSAFSRRIKALETWVGATLVLRSSHPVTLTTAGRQLLEAGIQAIDRIESERAQIRESLEQPETYVVTFGAQHSIGWRFFPAWLQAFESAYGPIISRLRADNLPNCMMDLEGGEVDFVIAYHSTQASRAAPRPTFESVVIGQDSIIPVCKPTSQGRAMFAIDNSMESSIPYLRFGPTAAIGRHVDLLLEQERLAVRLTTVYENSMAGALRIRARDGLGVAWLPKSLVDPDLDAGVLIRAGSEKWTIDVEIKMHVLLKNRNQLIRKMWSFLVARQGLCLV